MTRISIVLGVHIYICTYIHTCIYMYIYVCIHRLMAISLRDLDSYCLYCIFFSLSSVQCALGSILCGLFCARASYLEIFLVFPYPFSDTYPDLQHQTSSSYHWVSVVFGHLYEFHKLAVHLQTPNPSLLQHFLLPPTLYLPLY